MSHYEPQSDIIYIAPESSHRSARKDFARVLVLVVTFVVLMLTASVVGFRVIAVPPEQDVNDGKTAAYAKSRVTYKSADGLTCRTLDFDNRSGLVTESKPEPCYRGPAEYRQRSFVWGR